MADELDLETGDPSRGDDSPAARRRRRRQGTEPEAKASPRKSATSEDVEVTSRLDRVLDRIAKALEAREDDELASVIREDSAAMQQGFVSLTSSFKPLRAPLLMALNIVEPLLAFGRVSRILFHRVLAKRAARQAEWEAQQQGDPNFNGGIGEVQVYQ